MSDTTAPTIEKITRHAGIAGQIGYTVTVRYPFESPLIVHFTGSAYGGPVVYSANGYQAFVTDPDRFGEFGESWVRQFFA